MSSDLVTFVIKAKTRKAAIEEVKKTQQNCLYEFGHGYYQGHVGLLPRGANVVDQTFKSQEAAEAWIEENHKSHTLPMLIHLKGNNWLVGGWVQT